jgi:hypothetical protein
MDEIIFAFHKDEHPKSFPPWIRGTDNHFSVNLWKRGQEIMSHFSCSVISLYTCISHGVVMYVIYSTNKHGFLLDCDCNCFTSVSVI